MVELPTSAKPWRDLELYKSARLKEALVEAKLALEFLRDGLVRNAAGKAFQAWKAHLGALAAKHRPAIAEAYPGSRRIRAGEEEVVIDEADIVIALVPTSAMLKIATLVAEKEGPDVVKNTMLALQLHRYQYNGPDPEGVLSDIPDDKTAAHLICYLLNAFADKLEEYPHVCRIR